MAEPDELALHAPVPVPCQNSGTGSELVFCHRQDALRYSLIKPWTTCLRSILSRSKKNKIRQVTFRPSVRQAACAYSVIKPSEPGNSVAAQR